MNIFLSAYTKEFQSLFLYSLKLESGACTQLTLPNYNSLRRSARSWMLALQTGKRLVLCQQNRMPLWLVSEDG
jgi:hypothetical protein